MLKMTKWVFVLYFISLPLSIAGMEFFGWLFTFLVVLFSLKRQPNTPQFLKWGIERPLLTFSLIMIGGAFLVPELNFSDRKYIVGESRWILIFYATAALIHYFKSTLTREQISFYYFGFLSICTAISLYSMVQFFTGLHWLKKGEYEPLVESWGTVWRAKGFFSNTMTYSYIYAMFFCVFLSIWLSGRFKKNLWQHYTQLGSLLIIGISLVLTLTRGMWLALAIAVVVILYLSLSRKKWLGTLLLGTLFIFILATQVPLIKERVRTIVATKEYKSNQQRSQIWRAHWAMVKDHPWLGVGYRQNASHVLDYYERLHIESDFVGHAHNTYLQVLAGMGIPGLVAYLWFIFTLLRKNIGAIKRSLATPYNMRRFLLIGCLGAQMVFHLGGLTEAVLSDGEILHVFSAFMALLLVLVRQEASSSDRT